MPTSAQWHQGVFWEARFSESVSRRLHKRERCWSIPNGWIAFVLQELCKRLGKLPAGSQRFSPVRSRRKRGQSPKTQLGGLPL
ncbi:hypothetical protein MPNT_10259 [Candidatus Methylacidithermus pantelleriae]|uniref:Uncharacterized protein n=1 Tax=Candidatus Methylacidithermus pantelleriae TaxID=2744239 RepID=A0A8J2FV03_9BACT|nr:hypothetical protein MPNT_10259 [Candidatus Methylacidithermus pantelleriae]